MRGLASNRASCLHHFDLFLEFEDLLAEILELLDPYFFHVHRWARTVEREGASQFAIAIFLMLDL